jgi:hypothetical protein
MQTTIQEQVLPGGSGLRYHALPDFLPLRGLPIP